MSLTFESRSPWGHVNDRMRMAAAATAVEMAQEGERFIKERMEAEGKKDSGLTAQGIRAEATAREVEPGVMRCAVTAAPQQMVATVVLEGGRARGKPVSAEGRRRLAIWARRKATAIVDRIAQEIRARASEAGAKVGAKDVRAQAEKQAAFLVARAITRRGLKEFRFFRRARQHVQERSQAIWRRILGRFAVGGGGMR